eukprot:4774996-Prymnesium_polylepis.1
MQPTVSGGAGTGRGARVQAGRGLETGNSARTLKGIARKYLLRLEGHAWLDEVRAMPAGFLAKASPIAQKLAMAAPIVYALPTFDVILSSQVVYGEALVDCTDGAHCRNRTKLTLDLYQPAEGSHASATRLRPALLLAHGGATCLEQMEDYVMEVQDWGRKINQTYGMAAQARWFAHRGFVVAVVRYRLAHQAGNYPSGWAHYDPIDFNGTFQSFPKSSEVAAADARRKAHFDAAAHRFGYTEDDVTSCGGFNHMYPM